MASRGYPCRKGNFTAREDGLLQRPYAEGQLRVDLRSMTYGLTNCGPETPAVVQLRKYVTNRTAINLWTFDTDVCILMPFLANST